MSGRDQVVKAVIDISKIEVIKTTDGRFFAPGPSGRLLEIAPEGSEKALSAAAFLEDSEAKNSPGGPNFEAAKRLLEQYRILSLTTGGENDRFDLSAGQGSAPSGLPAHGSANAEDLVLLLDESLELLLSSPWDEFLDAGELLYARYVKPEYGARQTEFFMALFKCSRATYFRLLNRAIGLLSRLMFGA